jgi:hypothetical protein
MNIFSSRIVKIELLSIGYNLSRLGTTRKRGKWRIKVNFCKFREKILEQAERLR